MDNRADAPRLWIYDPETGRASPREVTVGPPIAGQVELQNGVEFGERIILAGADQLDESMQLYEMHDSEQARM